MLESYEAKIEAGTASKDGTYRERGVFKNTMMQSMQPPRFGSSKTPRKLPKKSEMNSLNAPT